MGELVMVAFVLGMLVLFVLGFIGLANPRWVGLKRRSRSSVVYFGSAVICLFIAVALTPESSRESDGAESRPQEDTDHGVASNGAEPIEYVALRELISSFADLTEAQRDRWREDNGWKHWVYGTCVVSEVSSTSWMSEIADASYEVTCELPNDDRAVLFYDDSREEEVMDLRRGDVLDFRGRLKTIRHWGFWSSGYVQVN